MSMPTQPTARAAADARQGRDSPDALGTAPCCQGLAVAQVATLPALQVKQGDGRVALARPCRAAGTRHLPVEILHAIFSELSLLDHSACALVCRHWYASLPDTRMRLARWQMQRSPQQRWADLGLVEGFTTRTGPWLQARRSPLLPQLHSQHLALRQQQALCLEQAMQQQLQRELGAPDRQGSRTPDRLQQQLLRTRCCFASLLRYSLQRCLKKAQEWRLEPEAIAWRSGESVRSFAFSPCGRWLATSSFAPVPDGHRGLRLHAFHKGAWQEESMEPPVEHGVGRFQFTSTPVNVLLCSYGHKLLAWRRNPVTAVWYRFFVPRCQMPLWYNIQDLAPMKDGDLVVLGLSEHPQAALHLLFAHYMGGALRYWGDDRIWREPEAACGQPPSCWTFSLETGQLALATGQGHPDHDRHHYTDALTVWRKHRVPGRAGSWCRQVSALDFARARVRGLRYSPDGLLLLALLGDQRVALLAVDARGRLEWLQTMPLGGAAPYDRARFSSVAVFRPDVQQLVMPLSLGRIGFWDRQENGQWQPGLQLEGPSGGGTVTDEKLHSLLLSSDGRTLLQLTTSQLTLWYQDADHHWRYLRQKPSGSGEVRWVGACCLPDSGGFCTTAANAAGRSCLWLHGPDAQGLFTSRASLETPAVVVSASPDGLSLMCWLPVQPPQLFGLRCQTLSGRAAYEPAEEAPCHR